MIVKNEAHCLAECLGSVRSIADEIVIADTGSTDGTVAVARRFGAKVFSIEWRHDFAEARNHSLEAATGDWLLHLDADEVLDPEGAARIRALVDADGYGASAIEVTLANYCNAPRAWRWTPAHPNDPWARGRSGYIAVPLLRLFRNRCGYHYREPVHENITESVLEAGGIVRAEPIVIHHYGYGGDAAPKGHVYLEIARRKAAQRPRDAKAWHDLAEQLLSLNQTAEAESAARRALEVEPTHLGAATTLGNILLNRGSLDEARALFEALEAAGTSPPHVVTALAAIACHQGRVEEAIHRLEAVIEAAPHTIMARLYYARALDLSGRAADARRQLEAALAIAPALTELQNRAEAHRLRCDGEHEYRSGHTQPALGTLVRALKLDPEDPVIHLALGVVLEALDQAPAADKSFTRACRLASSLKDRRKLL